MAELVPAVKLVAHRVSHNQLSFITSAFAPDALDHSLSDS
jgi:hypothetical protein